MPRPTHRNSKAPSKAGRFAIASGALLCQKLRCSLTVCQIQLPPLLVSSLHCIQMRKSWFHKIYPNLKPELFDALYTS